MARGVHDGTAQGAAALASIESVPSLGGTPRALVATEAGREAVEVWLRDAEQRGQPRGAGGGEAFLDLDPLRAELGLPTVAAGLGQAG